MNKLMNKKRLSSIGNQIDDNYNIDDKRDSIKIILHIDNRPPYDQYFIIQSCCFFIMVVN